MACTENVSRTACFRTSVADTAFLGVMQGFAWAARLQEQCSSWQKAFLYLKFRYWLFAVNMPEWPTRPWLFSDNLSGRQLMHFKEDHYDFSPSRKLLMEQNTCHKTWTKYEPLSRLYPALNLSSLSPTGYFSNNVMLNARQGFQPWNAVSEQPQHRPTRALLSCDFIFLFHLSNSISLHFPSALLAGILVPLTPVRVVTNKPGNPADRCTLRSPLDLYV